MDHFITFKEVGTTIEAKAYFDEEFIREKLAKMFISGIEKKGKNAEESFYLYRLFIDCFFSVALNNSEAAMYLETAIKTYKE